MIPVVEDVVNGELDDPAYRWGVEQNQRASDPATSTGRMMLNVLAILAEYERELIVERVNAGIAAARQSGTRFGRPLSDPSVISEKLAIAQDPRLQDQPA